MQAGKNTLSNLGSITIPALLVHGGSDSLRNLWRALPHVNTESDDDYGLRTDGGYLGKNAGDFEFPLFGISH